MASRRRDRLTIMAQILNIAREGTVKTRIKYRAALCFDQLKGYLSLLQEVELLKVNSNDGRRIYETTPKGVKYLKAFTELKACIHATADLMTRSNLPSVSFSKKRQAFIVDN